MNPLKIDHNPRFNINSPDSYRHNHSFLKQFGFKSGTVASQLLVLNYHANTDGGIFYRIKRWKQNNRTLTHNLIYLWSPLRPTGLWKDQGNLLFEAQSDLFVITNPDPAQRGSFQRIPRSLGKQRQVCKSVTLWTNSRGPGFGQTRGMFRISIFLFKDRFRPVFTDTTTHRTLTAGSQVYLSVCVIDFSVNNTHCMLWTGGKAESRHRDHFVGSNEVNSL